MATRVFSDEELDALRGFGELTKEGLIRFFTLTPADSAFLGRRRPENVFGAAVQLCTLPWLAFVPDDVRGVPGAAAARLSEQLGLPMGSLRPYAERDQTRTDHLREIAGYLGWRPAKALQMKDLDEFLLARAMEHDPPTLLLRFGCEYLRAAKVVRPGVVTMVERVASARAAARRETWARVAHLVTGRRAAATGGPGVVPGPPEPQRLRA